MVICTLGGHYGWNASCTSGEGIDAAHIGLPACQESFLHKLAALHKPVVGIHFDGRPLSSDAADQVCGALLEAWAPGAWGGVALAEILAGKVNPSGKLPCTVPLHEGQISVYYNHPRNACYSRHDGIPHNAYVDMPHMPRYCFGHGLSYTTFAYGPLTLDKTRLTGVETLTAELTVTNTGDRAGAETVQFYVQDKVASVVRPVQELVGFAKVTLAPGETRTVCMTLPMSQLAFLDANMRWKVERGGVTLQAGASCLDIRREETFTITADAYPDGKTRGFVAKTEIQ